MISDVPADRQPGLRSAAFAGYCVALLLGALNDNVFKLLLIFSVSRLHAKPADAGVIATAGAVFVAPFLLLTPMAGVLADRVSRSRLLKVLKAAEIGIMLVGVAGFVWRAPLLLYGTLFLMAAQSALFGPAKYSMLPDLVRPAELSRGNAVVALCTYVAIIAASGLAPWAAEICHGNYAQAQIWCVVIAVVGTLASLLVVHLPPAPGPARRASWWIVDDVWRTLRELRGRPYLVGAIVGSACFSLVGALVQANVLLYGPAHMGLTQERSAYLFLFAAGGIVCGSVLAGLLSGRLIEFGIVPLGALTMAAACGALAGGPSEVWTVGALLLLAGAGGGLFLIPLDAFIQRDAPVARRAEAVAASSFLGWVFVLLAQGLVAGSDAVGATPAQGFLGMAVLTLAAGAAAAWILPDFLTRFVVLVLTRLLCRVRVTGLDNVPAAGGGLLVSNHASYLDAALLIATQQRRLRFVMSRHLYERWWLLRPFFRVLNCIPIAGDDPPRRLAAAILAARAAVNEGYLVVIFPEGQLTRTGHLREFRRGFERVVRGTGAPIVPVYIGGSWGSLASFFGGRVLHRLPRLGRYPIDVLFGRPLPPDTAPFAVQQAVAELSCDYFEARKPGRRPLGEDALVALRRRFWAPVLADTNGVRLTGCRAGAAALLLSWRLRRALPAGEAVGIALPPCAAAALANLAAVLAGLVPVNLNFTASTDALRSAVTQSGLRRILTARAAAARLRLPELPAENVWIEEILAAAPPLARVRAALAFALLPARLLARRPPGFSGDTRAAILFSSGSTGQPKGVMLSHHNICSNVESLRMVFEAQPGDRLCAALPLFHSFGFTVCLWYPLLSDLPVVYHPNPLDAAGVGRAVREHGCTLLFGTPTFFALYARKIAPADFASLRFTVTGAERLSEAVATAFHERFGLVPREGYGATELSPVAAIGLPDVDVGGARQAASKPGTVGLPVPGVALKVVDPETGAALPPDTAGLLLVKGPNVMLGYLGREDLTRAAVQDGWYRTGDIASVDAEGFVRITDRLARFSKLGGEMVPHGAIEEALRRGLGAPDAPVAVTAVPDTRRGERLAVAFAPEAGPVERLRAALHNADLPNLWKPDDNALVAVPELPLLGSGKLDLARLRRLVQERLEVDTLR
jgi:acyl-[acyl-carrier-protein]-phospholipid O-acyltransferase/long-chain-fatty-acid--[acyl-carrier-protein] ligase